MTKVFSAKSIHSGSHLIQNTIKQRYCEEYYLNLLSKCRIIEVEQPSQNDSLLQSLQFEQSTLFGFISSIRHKIHLKTTKKVFPKSEIIFPKMTKLFSAKLYNSPQLLNTIWRK